MTLIEEARLIGAMPSPEEARRIREQAGIGVSRLAEEIGVNRATINLWETGQRRPRGENRLRYARILRALRELTDAA